MRYSTTPTTAPPSTPTTTTTTTAEHHCCSIARARCCCPTTAGRLQLSPLCSRYRLPAPSDPRESLNPSKSSSTRSIQPRSPPLRSVTCRQSHQTCPWLKHPLSTHCLGNWLEITSPAARAAVGRGDPRAWKYPLRYKPLDLSSVGVWPSPLTREIRGSAPSCSIGRSLTQLPAPLTIPPSPSRRQHALLPRFNTQRQSCFSTRCFAAQLDPVAPSCSLSSTEDFPPDRDYEGSFI